MYYKRFSPGASKGQNNNKICAVALGYKPGEDIAPRVLASGRGEIAAKIIALACENCIPIREDPILVSALAELDVNTIIPPELYPVVAEVLAFIYRIYQKNSIP
jgi:flagellar biosynthesis protein